jgi:hypothetical protein
MSSDTLSYIMGQFKYMVALMYQALLNTEPIITQQLALISNLRKLGNILLFVCFLTTLFVLVKTHAEEQEKKFWKIDIRKRWLIVMFAMFAVSLGVFNIYPSYKLSMLDKDLVGDSTRVADAQARLFGFESFEEARKIASRSPDSIFSGKDGEK